MLCLLLDKIEQPAGKVVPVNSALGDRFQPDTGISERQNPIATLNGIKSSETVLIPAKDNLELTLLSILSHSQKTGSAGRIVTTDSRVCVLPQDPVTMFRGIGKQLTSLIRDRAFLPTIAHPEVEYRNRLVSHTFTRKNLCESART